MSTPTTYQAIGRTTTWTHAADLRPGDRLAPHGDPAGIVTAVRDHQPDAARPPRVEVVIDGVGVLRWHRTDPVQIVCDPAIPAFDAAVAAGAVA